jgi:hypothetical protein
LYINPENTPDIDASVAMWARQSEANWLDQVLFETVQRWIDDAWPFENVDYPYRE